jgi:hypothetical protein
MIHHFLGVRPAVITAHGVKNVAVPTAGSTFGDRQLGENSLKQLADVVIQAVAQIRSFM